LVLDLAIESTVSCDLFLPKEEKLIEG